MARNPEVFDLNEDEEIDALEDDDHEPISVVPEPIVIKGNGNITVFGLSNSFHTKFPKILLSIVAKEQYQVTIEKVNNLLEKSMAVNLKWWLCGCLFCCCTIGCSLSPALFLNRRTLNALDDLLESENDKVYHVLGLNWSLYKQQHGDRGMVEYIILIEFLPKKNIYYPD